MVDRLWFRCISLPSESLPGEPSHLIQMDLKTYSVPQVTAFLFVFFLLLLFPHTHLACLLQFWENTAMLSSDFQVPKVRMTVTKL